ncbi:hypothetical protein ACFQH3_18350 [Haladaptatus sp. GCM10025707]|uniref:hypothetical protein n=1 Tax=unclassified Haladaptatus TaxID=2622732 RepID=UPI003613642A
MSNSTQTATNAPRSSGLLATLAEHKLLSAFLVFELVLLVTGFVIGTIAGPAPPARPGSDTSPASSVRSPSSSVASRSRSWEPTR